MKFLFSKLPTDKFFWISLALIVRAVLGVHLFVTQDEVYFNGIYDTTHSDAYYYLHAVENFIKTGDYHPSYRMPGLSLLFYVLRLFFSVKQAINGIIIIHILTAAVSVYYLALSLWLVSKNKLAFFICYFLFLISPLCMAYEFHPMSEPLCTSLLIFYFYNLIQYDIQKRNNLLWIAGLCIVSAVFFRPVYLPFIGIPFLIFALRSINKGIDWKNLIKLYRVVVPFIFFELLWVYHNYKKYDKFIPLQPVNFILPEGSVRYNLMQLLIDYGGDIVPWNDNSEINWFYNFSSIKRQNSIEMENVFPFPEELFQKTTKIDTLIKYKALIHSYIDDTIQTNKEAIRLEIDGLTQRMRANIKADYPFYFYVTKRFILLKKFVMNKGTYFLYPESFKDLNLFQKIYKIIASLIYMGAMILLPFGLILTIIRGKSNINYMYFYGAVIYTLIVFPFVLGYVEYKYISPAYPSILAVSSLFAAILLEKIFSRLQKK
ncbi:MAG TPA: hypothetical protein PK323_09675 [Bacteroidia bacterium]|nr:hypothetical protein [Bacteroidia bacterium]